MKPYLLLFLLGFAYSTQAQQSDLVFVKNIKQWEPDVKFKVDIPFGALFLAKNKIQYSFYSHKDLDRIHDLQHDKKNVRNEIVHCHAYDIFFEGANTNPEIIPSKKRATYHNYFLGNDPTKWSTHVPLFNQVSYLNLYKNIDLDIYSHGKTIKYDYIVHPGGNHEDIRMKFDGTTPSIASNGDLKIKTSINEISELAPYSYQVIGGKKIEVPCSFSLKGTILSYSFPKGYNKDFDLIIDPVLVFATYSGSTATTYGFSATYDLAGSLYAGGQCFNVGWATTTGAYQTVYGGAVDAGINKYTPSGNAQVYGTYFGGSSQDLPNNLVVNANNELIVFGSTASSNMPTTAGCFDNTYNGGFTDLYVAHFNAAGSALIGSTYIGGNDDDGTNSWALSPNYGDSHRGEVFVDASQNIICAGSTSSTNFPTSAGCYQASNGGLQDGCVFKLDPTCSTLLFSTYLGGTDDDACFAVNVNSNGDVITVGGTMSLNFPTTTNALHTNYGGNTDGFATMLNSTCSAILNSTFLGTSDFDHSFKMQIDDNDNVYVCGQSEGAYPVTAGLYTNAGSGIFIDKLNPTLSASLASTLIGQNLTSSFSNLVPTAFLYDECGNVYFSGFQATSGLPLTANAHQSTPGGFWICVLESNMTNLFYATYMGASGDHVDGGTSRFDPQGIIYQSVCTASTNQYSSTGSYSPTNMASSWDVASFKFDFEASGVNAGSSIAISSNDSMCIPAVIQFANNSTGATSYFWDFGDGNTSTAFAPSHTYTTPGVYTVQLKAFNPQSCVTEDSSFINVYIFDIDKPILQVKDTTICDLNATVTLQAVVTNLNANMTFRWEPASVISGSNTTQSVTILPGTVNTTFTLTVTDSVSVLCKEFETAFIKVNFGDTTKFDAFPKDTTICMGDTITLTGVGGDFYSWSPTHHISSTTDPVVSVHAASPVRYSVLISDIYGCSATRYCNVNTYPAMNLDAGDNELIKYGESIMLQASGALSYWWEPNSSLSSQIIANPVAKPQVTSTYYVYGTSMEGCKAKDSVTVEVTNAMVPNAFSPNYDGLNDVFRVKIMNDNVKLKALRVYNRWGQELFYSADMNIGWTGNYRGKPCDNGTYFYLIEYSIGEKLYTERGDLTLIR